MADNILKQSLEGSTPLFNTIFGSIQNELAKIEQNRQIAKQFARKKELIDYQAGIDLSVSQKKADIQLQKQIDYFDYKLENTPTPEAQEALSATQKHEMIMDVTRLFTSQAKTTTSKLGIPDIKVHTITNEQGQTETVIGQRTEQGVIPYNNLLQQYTNIENAENIKQKFIELQNEGKLNVDSVLGERQESNGVLYVGREDVNKILNFNPYEAINNPEELGQIMSLVQEFGSNIQPNTLPEDKRDSQKQKIKSEFQGIYTSIYKYTQPQVQERWLLPDKQQENNLGSLIKRFEDKKELSPSEESELERLMYLKNNLGKLDERFVGKNPEVLYLNPDASEVSSDISRILITKEEYEQKINSQRAGKDMNTALQSIMQTSKDGEFKFYAPSPIIADPNIWDIDYGDSGN